MRIVAFVVGTVLLLSVRDAAGQLPQPEQVTIPSGALRLTGLLWKPAGSEPFPVVVFNHGAGPTDKSRGELLGPVFAKHGYALLFVFRRGYGLSAAQGEFMRDTLDREEKAHGAQARKILQLKLLTTDHLDDVMAALSLMRQHAQIDAARIVVAGHSFGGQLAILAAERASDVRAAVTFAAAAQSWDESPDLQKWLLAAARKIQAPIFLTHAVNDFSITPGQLMAAELTRLKRPHALKIYRAVGDTPTAGHQAVYSDIAAWEPDVFAFLDKYVKPR